MDFLDQISPAMRVAIVSGLFTFIAAMLGALVVVIQIGRQAQQGRDQARHNEQLKIRQSVYEEFVDVCRQSEDASGELSSYVMGFNMNLMTMESFKPMGMKWATPRHRAATLSELHWAYSNSTTKIMGLQERWAIIDPRTDVLRIGISVASHDLNAAFRDYYQLAVRLMPMERDGQVENWPPSDEDLSNLLQAGEKYEERLLDVSIFVGDVLVEAQNLLLGEIFDNTVPRREPMDPKAKVLRLDQREELMHFFDHETEWGRNAQEAQNRAEQRYAGKED